MSDEMSDEVEDAKRTPPRQSLARCAIGPTMRFIAELMCAIAGGTALVAYATSISPGGEHLVVPLVLLIVLLFVSATLILKRAP